ncbi:hypothetical protein NQ315_013719 [Exocentrus adspersus]|uniref:Rab effector Noc2 n=1 Tax=Exocentrus adspersus TaxID=1586481 RepID=A0AAV8W523_9CUCU|nr:hypothetical protein NQ315_013719 [Exocentrus adspersus]
MVQRRAKEWVAASTPDVCLSLLVSPKAEYLIFRKGLERLAFTQKDLDTEDHLQQTKLELKDFVTSRYIFHQRQIQQPDVITRIRWSVKTGTLSCASGASKVQPLAAEEQEAIVQVIQRAEKIDVSEQERIGKLVERLENMRRCALGKNASQCLLCGDAFGMLGAQKVLCVDCRRLACQKCATEFSANKCNGNSKEYWLCMICAETREIWKKSGAWFFKSIPKYILPMEPRFARNRSVRMSRKYREDDSSSDEEKRVWNRVQRRNSSTESTHGNIRYTQN